MIGPLLRAIASGAKAMPSLLGRGAMGAGRAAATTGKALGTAAATTAGRTAIGAGVGGATGYVGGDQAEQALGTLPEQRGSIRNTSAISGALLGAGLASPIGRSQLHRFAGRTPEQSFRPVRDTANMLFKPTYPFEAVGAAGKGTVGRWVGNALRAAPMASAATGGVIAGANMIDKPRQLAMAAADGLDINYQEGRNEIKQRARANTLPLLSNLYGFNRDTTPIGESTRAMLSRAAIPSFRAGMDYKYQTEPYLYKTIDWLRRGTPFGNIQNSLIHGIRQKEFPDMGNLMVEELRKRKQDIDKDPSRTANSPLLRNMLNVVMTPNSVNDPDARAKLTQGVSNTQQFQALPSFAQRKVLSDLQNKNFIPLQQKYERNMHTPIPEQHAARLPGIVDTITQE